MTVGELRPTPGDWLPFRRNQWRQVPSVSGCYVLSTVTDLILYVGLAVNLRQRFEQHLDNPEKTRLTPHGRANRFHWLTASDLEPLERGWLNAHELRVGRWPILNKMASPLAG